MVHIFALSIEFSVLVHADIIVTIPKKLSRESIPLIVLVQALTNIAIDIHKAGDPMPDLGALLELSNLVAIEVVNSLELQLLIVIDIDIVDIGVLDDLSDRQGAVLFPHLHRFLGGAWIHFRLRLEHHRQLLEAFGKTLVLRGVSWGQHRHLGRTLKRYQLVYQVVVAF